MITDFLLDFSRVLLFAKDKNYSGLINDLYRKTIWEKSPFLDSFQFNDELLDYLKTLKGKYTLSIYTTDIVQNDPVARHQLDPIFENIFAANNLGISKKESNGYIIIAQKLQANPSQILFIDDSIGNIEAAKKAGLQAIHYTSNQELFKEIQKILQT